MASYGNGVEPGLHGLLEIYQFPSATWTVSILRFSWATNNLSGDIFKGAWIFVNVVNFSNSTCGHIHCSTIVLPCTASCYTTRPRLPVRRPPRPQPPPHEPGPAVLDLSSEDCMIVSAGWISDENGFGWQSSCKASGRITRQQHLSKQQLWVTKQLQSKWGKQLFLYRRHLGAFILDSSGVHLYCVRKSSLSSAVLHCHLTVIDTSFDVRLTKTWLSDQQICKVMTWMKTAVLCVRSSAHSWKQDIVNIFITRYFYLTFFRPPSMLSSFLSSHSAILTYEFKSNDKQLCWCNSWLDWSEWYSEISSSARPTAATWVETMETVVLKW